MVLEPKVLDYIKDDTVMFEREPMEQLAREGQLMCCKHNGFWQCMDTLRDKERLKALERLYCSLESVVGMMLDFYKGKKCSLRDTQDSRAVGSASCLQMPVRM